DSLYTSCVSEPVSSDLASARIDTFDTGSGKLFTNSPSKAYFDSISKNATAKDGTSTEDGSVGPAGDFYGFDWDNANALCATYNTQNVGGRTNWRLPTSDELKVELFDTYGSMFTERGWPTAEDYWSATTNGPYYDAVILSDGTTSPWTTTYALYTSCVSEPVGLAGEVIDIADTGSGKLFTNSPSVAYLESIGGSPTDDTLTEDGTSGPAGVFYKFAWWNANALCRAYNTQNVGGRTNWRLPTRDELKVELFGTFGNMFTSRGWPTFGDYWSSTAVGSNYNAVFLADGAISNYSENSETYVSCVSEP
ncbi:MAG: DUF1566 domain-containing protein, partial [Shewanella sp.]|nr:DUF1566 domain-containing protein [Shewanella sp.]